MYFAAREAVRRESREKGRQESIEEGVVIGREEGRVVGIEEGRQEERARIIKALSEHGITPPPEVADILNGRDR